MKSQECRTGWNLQKGDGNQCNQEIVLECIVKSLVATLFQENFFDLKGGLSKTTQDLPE